MYKPMDDDTSIASRCPRPPHGPFGSPLARSSSSHTRARERTRRANERTHARTRAGIFFFSLRYRHVDAHRYASRARSRPRVPFERAHSRIRAFARECDLDVRGRARTRRGRRGDAETRERNVWDVFWVAFARTSSSRRRRAVVARTTTGRRPDDDDASTG